MDKYLLLLSLVCMLFACNSDEASINAKAYEEKKQSLAEQEKTKPLAFLQVKSEHRKNWIGQTVVSGTVMNTAAVSSYKEIRLRMLCYDKNLKVLEEHEDILDAVIKPSNDREFKLRYRLPRGTDSIEVNVMSAAIAK